MQGELRKIQLEYHLEEVEGAQRAYLADYLASFPGLTISRGQIEGSRISDALIITIDRRHTTYQRVISYINNWEAENLKKVRN